MTAETEAQGVGQVLVTDAAHFDEDILGSPLPVMLDFWGPTCAPCLALMPSIEKLAARYAGKLAVYKIQSRENWRVAVQLKVLSLPTFILFKGGEETQRLTGDLTPAQLADAVEALLNG
jgi:thioredoxin 1